MRISDWSSDVCSSDLPRSRRARRNNRSEIVRRHASGFSRSLRAKQSKRAGGASRNAEFPDLRICQRRTRQTRGGACRQTQTHAWEPNFVIPKFRDPMFIERVNGLYSTNISKTEKRRVGKEGGRK